MEETESKEFEMRDTEVPFLDSLEEVTEYIKNLVNMPHDYGTGVYAMSMAAQAAFNHVASKLGVTGWQTSYADLDFIRRTRHIDGPFIIIKVEDAVYPQYDLRERLDKFLNEDDVRKWLSEMAQKNLDQIDLMGEVHPAVLEHWKMLAATRTPSPGETLIQGMREVAAHQNGEIDLPSYTLKPEDE